MSAFSTMAPSHPAACIAINAFRRFVPDCVSAASLRRMRMRLNDDAQAALADFYHSIDAAAPDTVGHADMPRLCHGLDLLRDAALGGSSLSGMPVLALAGGRDPLVPRAASAALASSGARLAVNPGGGHMLPVTHAAWCADAIARFVEERVAP